MFPKHATAAGESSVDRAGTALLGTPGVLLDLTDGLARVDAALGQRILRRADANHRHREHHGQQEKLF